MDYSRNILLFIFSSIFGALAALGILLVPILAFMGFLGEAGSSDIGFSMFCFLLFVLYFTIAGTLTAIMMRTFVGSHIISVKDSTIRFAIGSVIGALLPSVFLSIEVFPNLEVFTNLVAVGILITYAIGGTLFWLNQGASIRELESKKSITLNLKGRK